MTPISGVIAAGVTSALGLAALGVLAGRYARRRVSLILATPASPTDPPAEQPPTVPGLAYVPAAIRLCRRCDAYTPHNNGRQCHTCTRTTP